MIEQRRAVLRGLLLALLTVFLACAGSAVLNRTGLTRVTIDNQEWEYVKVRVWCDGIFNQIRMEAVTKHETYLYLQRCRMIHATAELPGGRRGVRVSSRELSPRSGQFVSITIPHNQEIVYLAVFSEWEAR